MKLLDVVELPKAQVLNGILIPDHTQGTIVHEWSNGLIEVEFTDPQVVVTLSRYQVRLVYSHELCQHTPEVPEG